MASSPLRALFRLALLATVISTGTSSGTAQGLRQQDQLTGDWGGARVALSDRGVELRFDYILDVMGNTAGGLSRGMAVIGNADLLLEADLEKLVGWRGARMRVYALGNHARSLSVLVGDLQIANNIEGPSTFRLFEFWLQQALGTPKLTLRGGLYDVNTEFDVIPSASLFIHSSPGMGGAFGNAGTNGPSSFPVTSLAARLDARPAPMVYLRAVVAEGVPGDPEQPKRTRVRFQPGEGALVAAEIGVYRLPGAEVDSLRRRITDPIVPDATDLQRGWFGKYALGGWGFTGEVQSIWGVGRAGVPRIARGSYGGYLLATQRLYFEPSAPEQGLAVYLRPGLADRRISLFDAYVGGGLAYRGLFPRRGEDRTGVSVSAAHFGPAYREDLRQSGAALAAWEVAFELTYRAHALGWLSLQPDLQIIVNPGGRAATAPALVLGLRTIVEL